MTATELWNKFRETDPDNIPEEMPEAWRFGSSDPNKLARLTMEGIKTATASAYPCYVYEKCALPKTGQYDIVLDSEEKEALCIIKNKSVRMVPFNEVTAEHAYKEGEGDRSLLYWRTVHQEVFTEELKEENLTFSEDMLVVCEEYERVF